jgi:AcrR family transcriptional regulator
MKKSQLAQSEVLVKALAAGAVPALPGMGRRERRAAETRLRLFRCALQLFAERGFSNVTVEDITEAADVGKGTFFNYFESKDHVLSVMPELQLAKVREAARLAAAGKRTVCAVLRQLALRLADEPGRSPDLARAVVSSFLTSEIVRGIVERQMSEGRTILAGIIAEGQKRGEIDRNLRDDSVALQLQQAILGTVLLWSLHGERPLAAWIEDSFQLFWRGICGISREQKS